MLRARPSAIRLTVGLLAILISSAAAAMPEACQAPRPMLPNGVERQVEGLIGDSHCYRLDLPAPGWWHLSLTSPANGGSRAHFEILDDAGSQASLQTVERSATERLTFMPPGNWWIRVTAEDPIRPIPAYRLTSRFVEAPPWLKSEEDGELEIESEGLAAGCGPAIFKSEDDGELEIESEGLATGCGNPAAGGPAAGIRQALCDTGGAEDHGDTLACATALRCRAYGELANGWGDDADVFRFRLGRWQTIEIATSGGPGTHGELFAAGGRRLDVAGGAGDDFRLVRTLPPGTYFLRVTGDAAGSYALELRDLDR